MSEKAMCVLTDGDSVLDRREMDVFEFIRANQDSKDNTDGEWWWSLDREAAGLKPFEVSLADSQGVPRGFHEEIAPSADWLRVAYGEHYSHVFVCAVNP